MFSKIILSLLLLVYIGGHIHGVNSTSAQSSGHSFVEFTKASMNKSVNPCNDFYTFACGNWNSKKFSDQTIDKLISNFLKHESIKETNSSGKKAKEFYTSCMNLRSQSHKIEQIVGNLIKNKMFKYHSNSTENLINMTWVEANFLFDEYGVMPFLSLDFSNNERISDVEITLKYPTQSWFPDIVRLMAFAAKKKNEIAKLYEKRIEIESFHANLTALSENAYEPETITLGEFIKNRNQDSINWSRVFEVAFNGMAKPNWKIRNYLNNTEAYNNLLQKTNKSILSFYSIFDFCSKFVNMFLEGMYKRLDGYCTNYTKTYFETAIMPYLVENISTDQWRENVLKTKQQIQDAFSDYIDQSTDIWVNQETKIAAKAKLNALKAVIGFTEEMKNRTAQNILFESLEISDNFYQNILNLMRRQILDFKLANRSLESNTFLVPLQYILFPFYNNNYTDLMRIGGFGFTIAHEMITLLNTKHHEFNEKHVSDRIAAKIAYDAFLKHLGTETNGYSEAATFLNMSEKQLFFLQFTQTMCSRKQYTQELEEHKRIRANTMFQNMQEFSEAYNCTLGANMNPEKKSIVL